MYIYIYTCLWVYLCLYLYVCVCVCPWIYVYMNMYPSKICIYKRVSVYYCRSTSGHDLARWYKKETRTYLKTMQKNKYREIIIERCEYAHHVHISLFSDVSFFFFCTHARFEYFVVIFFFYETFIFSVGPCCLNNKMEYWKREK